MNIHENYDLAPILRYQFGGSARYVLECKSSEDILQALQFTQEKDIQRVFILGTGSNLIFADNFFDGAIILVAKPEAPSMTADDTVIHCYAGEILDDLILFSFDKKLVGLEWAGGLPGTVGAAVRGNVGAFGGEIKDTIVSVEVAEVADGNVFQKTLSKQELNFSYRTSAVKLAKNMVILSATFGLKQATDQEVDQAREVYEKNWQYRRDRHPLEYPNCGSVFKNIAKPDEVAKVLGVWPDIADKVKVDWHGKVSMGYIIHKLGLGGYRVGNAQVSEKHNNFIVNLGGAKAADVKQIIHTIQEKAHATLGFTPEVEVEIVE